MKRSGEIARRPRDTLESKADIGGAASLEGRVHEELLEHVLLRMAAAKSAHAADGWTHQGDGLGVVSGALGELGLGNWQYVVAHDGRHGTAALGKGAHGSVACRLTEFSP